MTRSRETWDASGEVPDARSLVGRIRGERWTETGPRTRRHIVNHPIYEPGIPHEIQEAGIVRRVAIKRQVTETTGVSQSREAAFDAVGTESDVTSDPTSSM